MTQSSIPNRSRRCRAGRCRAGLAATLAAIVLSSTGALWADAALQHSNLARGAAPSTVLDKPPLGVDRINLFNGNLLLEIPLGISYPLSDALDYRFSLSYNANVWDHTSAGGTVTTTPNAASDAGLGWMLGFPRLLAPTSPGNESDAWIYVSADGAVHPFFSTLHADIGENDPGDLNQYTRDSTYLRMKDQGVKRTVQLPDGTEHIFRPHGTGWRLVRIRDRFGNYAHWGYSVPGITEVFDNHGRSHEIHYRNDPSGTYPSLIDSIVVTAFSGTTATYAFEYQTDDVIRGCHDSDLTTSSEVAVPLLSRINLPDGTAYTFTYAGSDCQDAGRLSAMTVPTLGGFAWAYETLALENPAAPSGLRPFLAEVSAVTTRSTVDRAGQTVGTWTYERVRGDQNIDPPSGEGEGSPGVGGPAQLLLTAVHSPLGDQRHHYFSVYAGSTPDGIWDPSNYGLPMHAGWPDASGTRWLTERLLDADGTALHALRARYLRFTQDGACDALTASCANTNRRWVSERTVFEDDVVDGVARYADVLRSGFDGLGNFRNHVTDGNFGNGDARSTFVQYNPEVGEYGEPGGEPSGPWLLPLSHPWVLSTYTHKTVTEGATSQTEAYCFNANNGFLKRQRRQSGSQEGAHDVVTIHEQANGHTVASAFYGSDLQSLDTSVALCDLSLPSTDLYRVERTSAFGVIATEQLVDEAGVALSFKSRDADIDLHTGLVAASRDSAGIETTFEYDALGRTTWSRPQAGQGTEIEHRYVVAAGNDGARIETSSWSQTGGSLLARGERVVDDFGRTTEERTLLADSDWGVIATEFGADGSLARRSAPYRDGDPVAWIDYLDHDALGRATRMVQPNGDETLFAYAGARLTTRVQTQVIGHYPNGVLYTQPFTRIEVRDRQDRLWQTTEERHHTDGAIEVATLEHDFAVDGQVIETRRNGLPIGFTSSLDGRGFLLAKAPNEPGLEAVTYSEHGPLGTPGRVVRGSDDLTQTYDRAVRLTSIADTADPSTVWKELIYGTASGGNDGWANGKLVASVRHDHRAQGVPTAFIGDGAVTETYEYHGRGGRRSRRTTQLEDLSGVRGTFDQTWTYTELGDVETLTYPQCITCPGWNETGPDRIVTYTYTNGAVTAIDGMEDGVAQSWVTSVGYHPSGLVEEVQHANGVLAAWDYDNSAPPQLASAHTAGHPWSTWDSGTIVFDATGRRVKVGDRFLIPEVGTPAPVPVPSSHGDPDCIVSRDPLGGHLAMGGPGCDGDNQLYASSPEGVQTWELALYRDPDTLERSDFMIWTFDDGRDQPLRTVKLAWGGWSNLTLHAVTDPIWLGNRLVSSGVRGPNGASATYAYPPDGGPITDTNGLPVTSTSSTTSATATKGAFVGWEGGMPWTKSANGFLPITGCLARATRQPGCRYGGNPARRLTDLRNGRLQCEQAQACTQACVSCCQDLAGPDSAQLLRDELNILCTGAGALVLARVAIFLERFNLPWHNQGLVPAAGAGASIAIIRTLCRQFANGFIPEARTCSEECDARFMPSDVAELCKPEPPPIPPPPKPPKPPNVKPPKPPKPTPPPVPTVPGTGETCRLAGHPCFGFCPDGKAPEGRYTDQCECAVACTSGGGVKPVPETGCIIGDIMCQILNAY